MKRRHNPSFGLERTGIFVQATDGRAVANLRRALEQAERAGHDLATLRIVDDETHGGLERKSIVQDASTVRLRLERLDAAHAAAVRAGLLQPGEEAEASLLYDIDAEAHYRGISLDDAALRMDWRSPEDRELELDEDGLDDDGAQWERSASGYGYTRADNPRKRLTQDERKRRNMYLFEMVRKVLVDGAKRYTYVIPWRAFRVHGFRSAEVKDELMRLARINLITVSDDGHGGLSVRLREVAPNVYTAFKDRPEP